MQIKPVHKMAIAGVGAALVAGLLVYVGIAWGGAAARGEERLLSAKMNRAALKLMAAASPRSKADAEEDDASDDEADQPRLTKLRYIAWLEQQLRARSEAQARLEKQAGAAAVATAQYAEFARLVLTASRPAAQADDARRPMVSKVSVQVLREYWRDTHGAALALPDDLFDRASTPGADAAATSDQPVAVLPATPSQGAAPRLVIRARAVPAKGASGGAPASSQVASIREAIEAFNRHEAPAVSPVAQ